MNEVAATELRYSRDFFELGPLSFQLRSEPDRPSFVGLVGANGAGKTTLLELLAGRLRPRSGTVEVLGRSPAWRRGSPPAGWAFVPDDRAETIPELTGEELWLLHAELHARRGAAGAGRGHRVSEMVAEAHHLADVLRMERGARGQRLDGMSHGQNKKAQLVAAMLTHPSVVLLDEPQNGLDPPGLQAIGELLRNAPWLRVALVSSHDLGWVGEVADRVMVLDQGAIVSDDRAVGSAEPGWVRQAFFDHWPSSR